MQVYKAPLKDYKFLIKDFLNSSLSEAVLKNSETEIDDLDMILEEAAKLCEEILLPLNQIGDSEGCDFNKGKVTTPKGFKDAYKSFVENGWQGITVNKKYGGQNLPYFINMFLDENEYPFLVEHIFLQKKCMEGPHLQIFLIKFQNFM